MHTISNKVKDNKKLKVGLMLTLLLVSTVSLGCIGGSEEKTEEEKLEVTEGIGIIGSIKVDDLNPGLDGYISLTLRNNLGGAEATNVVLALDNVYPFQIYECGTNWDDASDKRSDLEGCRGRFALDQNLPVRKHGLKKISPGQEVNPYWRLKAPSKDEISNIAVEHPVYWTMEYTYSLNFHENIIFMSQSEYLRRKDSNETTEVSGEAENSAGAIRISGSTDQPVMFVYDYPNDISEDESNFTFSTSYKVENQGKGFPISDIALVAETPDEVTITNSSKNTYKWSCWENFDEKCYRYMPESDEYRNSNCKNWIRDSSEELYNRIDEHYEKEGDDCKYIARKIENENFLDEFFIYAPLKIKGEEMEEMKKNNIPTKIYTFKIYSVYRYLIGGQEEVTVYPLKIY